MIATPAARQSPIEPPKTTERFYRPELDALRFIAFFSVFVYHFTFSLPNRGFWLESIRYSGAFGMCLFFILSAYLITELLIREKIKTDKIHIRAFYVRRILRIWPLYFAFIAGMWVCGKYLITSWAVSKPTVLSFVFLAGNWYLVYAPVTGPIMPLWSISLEEQFYLAWPTLAKLGRRTLLLISLLLVPVSYLVIVFLVNHGSPYYHVWWNSFVQFQYFGVGAALALLLQGKAPQLQKIQRAALFVVAPLFWAFGGYLNHLNDLGIHPVRSLLFSYIAASLGCMLLFFSFLGAPSKLIPDWMMQLGKISYGLYVFHPLCIDLTARMWRRLVHLRLPLYTELAIWFVCSLAFTVGVATLSFRFLEEPFLRFKKRFEFIETRAVSR